MRLRKMRIYGLKDISIEEIMDFHISKVTKQKEELVNPEEALSCTDMVAQAIYCTVKEGKPMPRKAELYHKYKYLIHLIITKSLGNKKNKFYLNGEILRSVLGDCVYDMIKTLRDMGIIDVSNYYEKGKKSRNISLRDFHIMHNEEPNIKVMGYRNKIIKKLEQTGMRVKYPKEFIDRYNKSLSFLEFKDEEGMQKYIEGREYKSEHQRMTYESCMTRFKDKDIFISTTDKNGRIYHYMTNLPKSLKGYFNIKFQMDISNSHPLLYSSFLIQHYKISREILEVLYDINIDITLSSYFRTSNVKTIDYKKLKSYVHYNSKLIRKLMKIRGLNVNSKKIPSDVLVYIYRVMKGKFWDDYQSLFHEKDRGAVKANLFREIFYSYSTRVKKIFKYGALFVKMYPKVWHVLRLEKYNNWEKLPNRMMKLESSLFTTILMKCYEQGWEVFNIHDAVVVLDIPANESCSPENVRSIIEETYHAHSLYPTVSLDMYQTPSAIS